MKRWNLRSRPMRMAGTVLVGMVAALAPASIAHADRYHPPGCESFVRYSWADTCWVGWNYINDGLSVLGVQYILVGQAIPTGTPDCYFGPRTDAG
jgi:hypothetical protein